MASIGRFGADLGIRSLNSLFKYGWLRAGKSNHTSFQYHMYMSKLVWRDIRHSSDFSKLYVKFSKKPWKYCVWLAFSGCAFICQRFAMNSSASRASIPFLLTRFSMEQQVSSTDCDDAATELVHEQQIDDGFSAIPPSKQMEFRESKLKVKSTLGSALDEFSKCYYSGNDSVISRHKRCYRRLVEVFRQPSATEEPAAQVTELEWKPLFAIPSKAVDANGDMLAPEIAEQIATCIMNNINVHEIDTCVEFGDKFTLDKVVESDMKSVSSLPPALKLTVDQSDKFCLQNLTDLSSHEADVGEFNLVTQCGEECIIFERNNGKNTDNRGGLNALGGESNCCQVLGRIRDIEPSTFFNIQLDDGLRCDWDSNAMVVDSLFSTVFPIEELRSPSNMAEGEHLQQKKAEMQQKLDNFATFEDDTTGVVRVDVVRWHARYPKPMSPREYVFLRAKYICPSSGVHVMINRQLPPHSPILRMLRVEPCQHCVSMDDYESILLVPSRQSDDGHFDFFGLCSESSSMKIPGFVRRHVWSVGLPTFFNNVKKEARRRFASDQSVYEQDGASGDARSEVLKEEDDATLKSGVNVVASVQTEVESEITSKTPAQAQQTVSVK